MSSGGRSHANQTTTRRAPADPALAAFATATRTTAPELVQQLRELLGSRLVAYLGGVKQTRTVRDWAEGTRQIQSGDDELRLRTALQAALMLASRDEPGVIQAWFQGLNPQLEDRSPAAVLRDGDIETAGRTVLSAARAFAAVG